MPQIKNLGMPMAGPVPAMPPSPAGLPQNKPGPTAVTQTEPEPDDLTKIFNSYTSGQIDRNSLIEQLRNISSGRGGILALLETMEGKAQPEAAGDFAPVPAAAPPVGALPGSPPALVAPEAQPELDARHQRISQMLQSYGLQPLDADQMSTELNPQHTAADRWDYTAPTPAVKKKTAAESGLTMGTPAAVKAPVLPSTAQTPVPQTLTADMAAPAAAPVAAPPAATTPTALPTIVPTTQPPREFDYTPESAADMQARIRQESEGREHIFGGTTYVMRNGQLIPKEEERVTEFGTQDLQRVSMGEGTVPKVPGMATPPPEERVPDTKQGAFSINPVNGNITYDPTGRGVGQKITLTPDEPGSYIRQGVRGYSPDLQQLLQQWEGRIMSTAPDPTGLGAKRDVTFGMVFREAYATAKSGFSALSDPDVTLDELQDRIEGGTLSDEEIGQLLQDSIGEPIKGQLEGLTPIKDFFVTVGGLVGVIKDSEVHKVASPGFNFMQDRNNMVGSASADEYGTENDFVQAYRTAAISDLGRLADDMGFQSGEARDKWVKEQTSKWLIGWTKDAKIKYGTYKTTSGGSFNYDSEELKKLTDNEIIVQYIDMNADNPAGLEGLAEHILRVAEAKGNLDDAGNWDMALQDDRQAFEHWWESIKHNTVSVQQGIANAMAGDDFDEAVRQFGILQALNNAQLELDSRRLDFDIDQGKADQAEREARLTGWFQKQTWVYTPATGGSVQVTENVETMEHMELALLTIQTAAQVAGVTGVYRYQEVVNGELVWTEVDTLAKAQLAVTRQELAGEIGIFYPSDHATKAGEPIMVEGPGGVMVPATVKTVAQKRLDQDIIISNRDFDLRRELEFGDEAEAVPLTERNPVLSGLLTGLEGLRQTSSGMDAGAALSYFASNSLGLVKNWLMQKPGGATATDLLVPAGLVPGTNRYQTNPDGSLTMRTGSIEEAADYLNRKLESLARQGTAITEAQLTALLPVEPKPDSMSAEGLAAEGAGFSVRLSAAEIEAENLREKNRLAEEARQFNDSMELQREMMVLEKMQLDTAMQRLYADQRRVEIEDKLARSEIFTNAEQITISKQLADIQQQISDTNKKQMLAELSGMLNDEPTLAGQQFALSKMLAKATATGQITFDGVTQDTLELSRFMWEKDMENKKLELDTARLDQERQIAQQTTTLAENRYALDAAIQVGELQNAVAIRQNTMMVEQQKQLLERDKLRTDTLLALSNPGLMVFVQRYGLLDELGAALGIDFTDEASGGVPTAASMWDTTAYPFPSAQQLKGMSASERQIVLAESAAASDMSLEAGMGAIAGGIPGYQEIQTLTRPTMLTGEAR